MGAAERVHEVDAFEAARGHLAAMEKRLSSPEMLNATHSELEKYVVEQGRELERRLLQAHLDLRAARERAVDVTGADGIRRTTMRESQRPLLTLVGRVEVERTAYQAHDVDGLYPADAVLNVPPELYSHGVRRVVAEQAARSSFDEVVALLEKQTGTTVPKRQVEELSVRARKTSRLSIALGARTAAFVRRATTFSCSRSTARASRFAPRIFDRQRARQPRARHVSSRRD